ncbi:hypothetical protein EX30DRAFT_300279 [Ascodesmis nigricans]|uniref:Ribosomal protein S36, mitochondrial n=1 Tax=Ascodesmis nigricans TaxID=341454 RepID=A0A4S2N8U5_9PEZI|nr:hypothetical protein EX30DRAFT_300279 [Ascodesmis nigricans]
MTAASSALRAAAHARTPMIQFIGKRAIPTNIDHSPKPHPQSPTGSLPSSFAEYRKAAQSHGPLGVKSAGSSRPSIEVQAGEYFDRNELPKRFWRMTLSKEDMELIESGGAAAWA